MKIIFITGLTASGKSDLAIFLAKKIKGVVINADSRQVYKYLDWGSGKIEIIKIKRKTINGKKFFISYSKNGNIPHYLISQVNPKNNYSLAKWLEDVDSLIKNLSKEKRKIIICGGTILYLKAIKEGWQLPKVSPDAKLRRELEKESIQKLYNRLLKLDPQRAMTIDKNNKIRLIRAIEIAIKQGKIPPLIKIPKYDLLILAPDFNWRNIEVKIKKRLEKRAFNIVKEIIKLRNRRLSFKRIISFGLEYRWFGLLVKKLKLKNINKEKFNKIKSLGDYQNIFENCYRDIRRFARKQWRELKKISEVIWVKNKKNYLKTAKEFLGLI